MCDIDIDKDLESGDIVRDKLEMDGELLEVREVNKSYVKFMRVGSGKFVDISRERVEKYFNERYTLKRVKDMSKNDKAELINQIAKKYVDWKSEEKIKKLI